LISDSFAGLDKSRGDFELPEVPDFFEDPEVDLLSEPTDVDFL